MAGSAHNADDDEIPNFSESEDSAESTIAMEAPSFELPSNVPLPISSPPPPLQIPPLAATPVDVRPASKPLIVVPPPKPASARFPVAPQAAPTEPNPAAAPTLPNPAAAPIPHEPSNELPTRLVKAPSRELLEKDEPLRPSQKSPLASTAFGEELPDEIETRAISRADLDAAKALPDLSTGGGVEPEDEPTRAVGKHMLRPLQDAHVVVGDDAIGDEATVAVPAGANAAANLGSSPIAAALRETLGQPDEQPTFPPPPGPRAGVAGAVGPGVPRPHQPTALGMAPPPPPQWLQQQQQPPPSMGGQRLSNPGLPPMSAPYPQSGPMQAMQPSSAPYPSMPQQPHPMSSMGPHGTMMHPGGPSQGPIPWQPGPPEPKQGFLEQLFGRPVPGQMILLVAVGTVCLAIFITGIVLFAKTKM